MIVTTLFFLALLIWGLYSPVWAAISYLFLAGSMVLYLFIEWKFMAPRPADRTQPANLKQLMLVRYHKFFKNPPAAVGLSRVCSTVALFSVAWVLLLLWKGEWPLLILVAATGAGAAFLASVLKPLSASERQRSEIRAQHFACSSGVAVFGTVWTDRRRGMKLGPGPSVAVLAYPHGLSTLLRRIPPIIQVMNRPFVLHPGGCHGRGGLPLPIAAGQGDPTVRRNHALLLSR